MTDRQKIKSKKVVVYFYQSEQGGGSFHFTDEHGKLSTSPGVRKAMPFANVDQAMEMFQEIAQEYMVLLP
jgi:hypothetical protein